MFDVSDKALKESKAFVAKKTENKYFRISVNGGGCQGFPITLASTISLKMTIRF